MIFLTSDHLVINEGYANKTTFTITVKNLPANSYVQEISYIWGDTTKKDFKPSTETIFSNPIEEKKTYSEVGTYKIDISLKYKLNNKIESVIERFNINVKEIPSNIFLVEKTTRSENSKLYARVTRFNFKPNPEIFGKNLENLKYVRWDFGNGVISNKTTIEDATFEEAGTFVVKIFAYTKENDLYEYKETFKIEEYLNDSIIFSKVPPPTYAGHLNRFPFEVEITSTVDEPHIVDLYAQFSRSYPSLDNPTKYSFLRPEWRFLDLKLKKINNIETTENTPIRVNEYAEIVSEGGYVVGYKGKVKFYFVDDWFNQDQILLKEQYTTLWATLRSNNIRNNKSKDNIDGLHAGHANNTAQAWCPYVTLWRRPDSIKFTRNGAESLPSLQFSESNVPMNFVIGYKDDPVLNPHNKQASLKLAESFGFAHYVPHFDTKLLLEINDSASSTPVSSFFIPKEQPFIQYKNSDNLLTGGYYKTTYERKNFSNTLTMSAKIVIPEPDLRANNFNPQIWLLNPNNAEVNIAQYIYTTNEIINNPQYFYTNSIQNYLQLFQENRMPVNSVKKNPNMNTVVLHSFKTELKTIPHISSPFDNIPFLNGIHNVAALNAPTYHAWIADIETDKIYRVTSDGLIYITIDLNNINYNLNATKKIPHSMVLDKDYNLFVALAGSRHILKFDDFGVLRAILNTNNIIPICLDVDVNNDLYVSGIDRSQTKRSVLLKYDNNLKTQILNKTYSNIFLGNILVSPSNKIYVITEGHLNKNLENNFSSSSNVEELNCNNFSFVKKYGPNSFIKHLTIDKYGNIYYSHSYNSVMKISTDGKTKSLNIKSDEINTSYKTVIDGLNCNINDKIYAINSFDNKVNVLDTDLKFENSFYINPSKIEYEITNLSQLKIPLKIKSNPSKRLSLKANGDFTGWKWNYKFGIKNTQEEFTITNRSKTLVFNNKERYKFLAKNESFDLGKYMYDFSFMKSLQESPFLYNNKFYDIELERSLVDENTKKLVPIQHELNKLLSNQDFSNPELIAALQKEVNELTSNLKEVTLTKSNKKGFFGSIFGTFPYDPDDIGVSLFSKIANFVEKTADPDTCDITHLYDIISKIDFKDEGFRINFPKGIDRIIDYVSIPLNKLLGIKCNCSSDIFKYDQNEIKKCNFCGREVVSNKGEEISDPDQLVFSGEHLVLKNKRNQKYRKVSLGPIDNSEAYTITKLATSIGLPEEWRVDYNFYKYVPRPIDFIESRVKQLDSFDLDQITAIQDNSSEFKLLKTFNSNISTHIYGLTSFVNFATVNLYEWLQNIDLLNSRTVLNFTSSLNLTLSSLSYYWETSSFVNFDNFQYLQDNILTLSNYRQGYTLSNVTSSIEYKQVKVNNNIYRTESVIDWDDPQTTLPLSFSKKEWYRRNGIIDQMINYELQKGLGLI